MTEAVIPQPSTPNKQNRLAQLQFGSALGWGHESPTNHDLIGSPKSTRKVSHSESLKALAAIDLPSLEPDHHDPKQSASTLLTQTQNTPQQQHRRKSLKDRTPRQVQPVLSARKSAAALNASARKVLRQQGQLKDQTPMNMLRALSRMHDLPPPTPDPEISLQEATASQETPKSVRPVRHSLIGLSRLGVEINEDATADENQELSPSDSESVVEHSLIDQDGVGEEVNYMTEDHARDVHSRQSVELGRRDSVASSVFRSPGTGRGRLSEADSLLLAEGREEDDPFAGDAIARERYSLKSRVSAISLEGMGDRSTISSPSGSIAASVSASHPRYSDFANLSATSLKMVELDLTGPLPDVAIGGLEERDKGRESSTLRPLEPRDEQEESFEYEQDFGGGLDDEEEGEGGEDLTDRIPWEEKGKGKMAVEKMDDDMAEMNEEEEDILDVDPDQGTGFEGMGFSDDERDAGRSAEFAKLKQAKPKLFTTQRTGKKLKQRYTSDGREIPSLPNSFVKSLFLHYLGAGSKVKLDLSALDAVVDASHEFFEQLVQDSEIIARNAGRKTRLQESDVVNVLYRQKVLTPSMGLQALSRQHGLDRELQTVVDGMASIVESEMIGEKKRKRKASAAPLKEVQTGAGTSRAKKIKIVRGQSSESDAMIEAE